MEQSVKSMTEKGGKIKMKLAKGTIGENFG